MPSTNIDIRIIEYINYYVDPFIAITVNNTHMGSIEKIGPRWYLNELLYNTFPILRNKAWKTHTEAIDYTEVAIPLEYYMSDVGMNIEHSSKK